jgi:hypothetical protein
MPLSFDMTATSADASEPASSPVPTATSTAPALPTSAPVEPAGVGTEPGDIAPDFTLPSANGPDVTLSALSAQQPVVLVFYRAFW